MRTAHGVEFFVVADGNRDAKRKYLTLALFVTSGLFFGRNAKTKDLTPRPDRNVL